MKVIFLDIDGVLNTSETFIERKKYWEETGVWTLEIDEFRIEYLKQIIDETDAKVVLSSTWKKDFENIDGKVVPIHEKGVALLNILNKYNIELYDILKKGYDLSREDLITIWLNEHPNIESFIILDDETTHLKRFVGKQLIKTSILEDGVMLKNMDDCIGLCEDHIPIAIKKLNDSKVLKKNFK
jgi:hypothetical protein